jgi:hypothetical protein
MDPTLLAPLLRLLLLLHLEMSTCHVLLRQRLRLRPLLLMLLYTLTMLNMFASSPPTTP